MPTRVFPKEGVVDYAHLAITECGMEECRHDGKREHYHTLNPRAQAMKGVEMTVRRALLIIEAFDNIPDGGKDWTDADVGDMRKALGEDTFDPRQAILPELWARYKTKALHQEVLDLADNIVLDDLSKASRKEIKDGINRIRKELDG